MLLVAFSLTASLGPSFESKWPSVQLSRRKRGEEVRMARKALPQDLEDLPVYEVQRRPRAESVVLCSAHVLLGMSGPVLLDWLKRAQGGSFRFSIAAMTFHAYCISVCLGLAWTCLQGRQGWRRLNRPDMIWRFGITASLFTAGDILNFAAIQHLDAGSFSLLGKGLNIVLTVLMTRLLLGRRQTSLQYLLVLAISLSTLAFLRLEGESRFASMTVQASASLPLGVSLRAMAALFVTLAAVLQERILTKEPSIPFLLQQCWMGVGALGTSLITLRLLHGLPWSRLFFGFDDWRVLLVLAFYVANGLTAGLMVKRLGALSKALCVPLYLGGCYAYSVASGGAALSAGALAAWAFSTAFIVAFAVSKIVVKR